MSVRGKGATGKQRNRRDTTAIVKRERHGLQLLPENAQWKNRFQIAGSTGNLYTIAQRKSDGSWGCSCPGWIRHRHCKHLDSVRPVLSDLSKRKALPPAKR